MQGALFEGCTSLTEIQVEEDHIALKAVDNVLYDCYGALLQYPLGSTAEEYVVEDGTITIAIGSFSKSNVKSVVIPDSVTTIAHYAFRYCENLSDITFGKGVTTIENQVFAHCSGLESITIPKNVTSIGASAFWDCDNLTGVTILSRDVVFGSHAFYDTPENIILYGYRGSTTEAYAAENGHSFVALGEPVVLAGDLDDDGFVDILDAMLLFQHSMLPDLFPISYPNSFDFTKDGVVDIADAMYLFQHSMLPDMFPIE